MKKYFFNQNIIVLLHPQKTSNIFCYFLCISFSESIFTNNNTPSMPLYDAHLEGFLL